MNNKKRAERCNVRQKTIYTNRIIQRLCKNYKSIIEEIVAFIENYRSTSEFLNEEVMS